jgi:outer membrane receptor protein involved in Fe transport
MKRFQGLAISFLIGCCAAVGQVSTSSISGTITDSSGAAVADASVTAIQTDTNLARTAQTNKAGQYQLLSLPIGPYRVEVNGAGFKKFEQSGVVLDIDRNARIDAVLEVGELSQTISVAADATRVNTAEASLGRTVENREILNLPLVNRDVYTLLTLTPGVDDVASDNPLGSPTETVAVNGSSTGTGSINYFLDGGNNTSGLRNTGNPAPNPDAVQEFRVITNSFGAEFGRFAGGVVDVVTKSGTNSFHGSLFEFLRNDKLNANTYGALTKSPLHRNQFGGTFGGPIVKDKLFFFGGYSGLRQRETYFKNSAIVPTDLERQGNFSQTLDSKGQPVKITDPSTKQLFPGGIIPANKLDLAAQNILTQSIPKANLPGDFYQATVPHPFDTDEVNFKMDYLVSQHQVTGSYFRNSGQNLDALLGSLPWASRNFTWAQDNINLGDTWTISPTIINQFRATYMRDFGGRVPAPQQSLADFGSNFVVQGTPSLPQIGVTGYFSLNNAISGPVAGSNYYGLRDVFSFVAGKHSVKVGADMYLEKLIHDTLLNNYGVFSFDGSKSGNALADFVLGTPRSMSQDAPITKYQNDWYYGFFIQDDYRVTSRLTLNLGLRYDLQLPFTDPSNRYLAYVAGRQSTAVPGALPGLLFPGDKGIGRGIIPADKNNFAPRVGFAYDPTGSGKTSIRGAAGLFYGSPSANEWNISSDHQPFTVRQTFPNVATLSNPYANVAGGSPFPYTYSAGNPRFLPNADVSGINLAFRWPYTYQMNFSVQRQIAGGSVVTASYVGSLAHKLPFQRDTNYPIYTPAATSSNVNNRRPIQPTGLFSQVLSLDSSMNTSYHGLQLSVESRLARHFAFKGYYTFSKALDGVDLQASNVNNGAENFNNLSLERGRTASDRRHNAVVSLIWDTNYFNSSKPWLRWTLNGWTISGILSAHSGDPFTVTAGRDVNLDGNSSDRANITGNPHLDPNRSRNDVMNMWFNTAAFVSPATGQDGNAARNLLDSPGSKNADIALFRDFPIRENIKLQFRAEMTNAFNIVNLSNPDGNLNSRTFGTIRTAGAMRQSQLGLRLSF